MPVDNKLNPYQEAWLDTLETTDDPQGHGRLVKFQDTEVIGYCCLGIAAKTQGVPDELMHPFYTLGGRPALEKVRKNLCLRTTDGGMSGRLKVNDGTEFSALTSLNDSQRLTFPEIAFEIRNNPGLFFTNFDKVEETVDLSKD